MALSAKLTISFTGIGPILGQDEMIEATEHSHHEVFGWSHEVVAPRDSSTGLPSNKRVHKPLTIIKRIDRSSALFMQALCTNKRTDGFVLMCYEDMRGKDGTSHGTDGACYQRIELMDASISSIRQESLNNRYAENGKLVPMERISFCYDRIEWNTYGKVSDDSWSEGRSA